MGMMLRRKRMTSIAEEKPLGTWVETRAKASCPHEIEGSSDHSGIRKRGQNKAFTRWRKGVRNNNLAWNTKEKNWDPRTTTYSERHGRMDWPSEREEAASANMRLSTKRVKIYEM